MPFLHERKKEPWFKLAEEKTFRTGLRHKIFYPEGGYYKGFWKAGFQSGKGIELLPSGLKYEGDWLCNKKNGFGVLSKYDSFEKTRHTVYLGDFKNNKKHGYGCMHFDDGTFYEGEFKSDNRHGFGRCWFHNGDYYEGYWVKNKQHGYGMIVQANGNRYEGAWAVGKKDGWGVFYHLDSGQKQVGLWENDNCITSEIKDIKFRQSAVDSTSYPIQILDLDPNAQCQAFLSKADQMIFQYNEGCQLHKYCYKISPPKSRKEFIQEENRSIS